MGETVKVQLEIDTQLGTEPADVHEWTEELVDGLNWALCDQVQVSRGPPFELKVWLRTRDRLDVDEYAENFGRHFRSVSWCIVEDVVNAESVER